jgi:hypothetical protein
VFYDRNGVGIKRTFDDVTHDVIGGMKVVGVDLVDGIGDKFRQGNPFKRKTSDRDGIDVPLINDEPRSTGDALNTSVTSDYGATA